jgi:hypothetical protein
MNSLVWVFSEAHRCLSCHLKHLMFAVDLSVYLSCLELSHKCKEMHTNIVFFLIDLVDKAICITCCIHLPGISEMFCPLVYS